MYGDTHHQQNFLLCYWLPSSATEDNLCSAHQLQKTIVRTTFLGILLHIRDAHDKWPYDENSPGERTDEEDMGS